MTAQTLRVVVADDDQSVRDALADLLRSQPDVELVATAADHPGTLAAALGREPDVILMDLRMPGGSAAETIRTIRNRSPRTGVLALSAYEDGEAVMETLAAGAFGYLVKGVPDEEILEALHRAAREQLSISATLAIEVIRKLGREIQEHRRAEQLLQMSARQFHALFDRAPSSIVLVSPDNRIQLANERTREVFGYAVRELIGQSPSVLLPERYRGSDPTRVAAGAGMRLTGRRKDGGEFPAYIAVSMPQSKDQLQALFFHDVSDLQRMETRYLRVVEAFPDPVLVVNSAGLIVLVSEATERLFGYEHGELVGSQLDNLLLGYPLHQLRSQRDRTTAVTNATLRLTANPKHGENFTLDANVRPLLGDQWLLVLTSPKRTEEGPEEPARAAPVTQSNGRHLRSLLANLLRGQEEERQRIASGIHDDTLQVVTAVALRVQQMRRRLSNPKDLEVLEKLDETVQLAINRLRHLIFDLRPPLLDRGGLVGALRSYLEQMRSEGGVGFTLQDQLDSELSDAVRALVYRIAHEALTNVRKHAHATHVTVELIEEEGGLRVRIDDDGVGFDPSSSEGKAGHLGLRAIRERVTVAGGWSRIDSEPGVGSVVEFWVPTADSTGELSPLTEFFPDESSEGGAS
jgi:PAS domain S-box-containing protein